MNYGRAGLGAVAAILVCACGGKGDGGAGSAGAGKHTLTLSVTGAGAIQLSTGDTCRGQCAVPVADGAHVTATAVADAGSQFSGWSGACSGAAACEFTAGSDLALAAAFSSPPPPPSGSARVTVSINGSGSVRSTPAGIDCGPTCEAVLPAGTNLTLTPTPAAGWTFQGFGGPVCHGSGPCAFTVSTDATVYVTFAQQPPPPPGTHQLRLAFAGAGAGRVTSTPAAVDCTATCAAPLTDGTSYTLTATPAAGSSFHGWTGLCSGTGPCTLAIAGDGDATATFDLAPPDDCAGLVPAAMGEAVLAAIPHGGDGACTAAFADQQGNIAAAGGSSTGALQWTTFSTGGARLGSIAGQPMALVPQDAGFQGTAWNFRSGATPFPELYAWLPDGTVAKQTGVGNDMSAAACFPSSVGGSVVTSFVETNDYFDGSLSRFDAAGNRLAYASIAEHPATPTSYGAATDANGNTLFAALTGSDPSSFGTGPQRMVVRWYDPAMQALTGWIDAGPQQGRLVRVHALIGGGVAIEQDGNWVASFGSGSGVVRPAPGFLANQYDFAIVRGRRAYALIPDPRLQQHNAISIFTPAGKSCGGFTVPNNPTALHIGADGTVIANGGSDGCAASWYPQLLR